MPSPTGPPPDKLRSPPLDSDDAWKGELGICNGASVSDSSKLDGLARGGRPGGGGGTPLAVLSRNGRGGGAMPLSRCCCPCCCGWDAAVLGPPITSRA